MEIYPYQMFISALWVFVCGAAMGVIYDILRFTRALFGYVYRASKQPDAEEQNRAVSSKKPFKTVLFIEDVGFVLLFCVIFIVALFYANDGAFRLLFLASMLLGFYFYRVSIGRLTSGIVDASAHFLRGLIARIARPLGRVVIKLCRRIKRILKKIYTFSGKHLKNRKQKDIIKEKDKKGRRMKNVRKQKDGAFEI